MPLTQPPSALALPFIDPEPTPDAIAAAHSLIQLDLPANHTTCLHPSIPLIRQTNFTPLIETEHTRLASGSPKTPNTGIGLSRYEAPEAPAQGSGHEVWTSALQQAYTSAEYLRGRETNLALLETYGKNAWLVGNSALEDELRSLEREVEVAKAELEGVEQARRAVQGNAAGEMQSLEEGWRVGVGRMIEAQAAGEGLRGEILGRRREGAR